MSLLVADTSALVSLGTVADWDDPVLDLLCERHDLFVPVIVREELREVAGFDDVHGTAARAVLDRIDAGRATVHETTLDESFPLDDGENAAVVLANDRDADLLLCDEFGQLGLVHASLADTRVLTTPTVLASLVRNGMLSRDRALEMLDAIADARSWARNSYVERARAILSALDRTETEA